MIRRYVGLVVSFPKTVIALVVATTILLGVSITKLQMVLDVDAQIPQSHPLVMIGKRLEKLFGGKYLTVIGFYPEKGTVYTPAILGKVKRVTEAVEKIPGVKPGSVMSLMSEQMKDIRSTEEAIEVKPLAKSIPANAAEMAKFVESVKHNSATTSLVVSADGRATTVLVDFEDFEKAGGARSLNPTLQKILDKEREKGLEIEVAGATSVTYWLMVYVKRVGALFGLSLMVIAYLLYRAFRTLQGMFIPLVTALMGVFWALGMMGAIGAPMDPWNAMTPILLLAIGAGHSVQIMKRYYEEYGRIGAEQPELSPVAVNREAVIEATTKMGSVMLAAGSIAALSFASLAAMGLASMKNFGLCTAFGIMSALIIEMSFIPAVRVMLKPPTLSQTEKEKKKEFFDPILERLARIVREKRERPLFWVSLAVIVVAVGGLARLETRSTLAAQFFEGNGPMRGFRLADERTAGTRVIQVLVDGKSPDSIKNMDVLRRMDALSAFIKKADPSVGKVQSIVDVIKVMNRVIDNDNPKSEILPDSSEAAAQFLMLYGMSGDEKDLRRLVDADYQRAVITIFIKTDDHNVMKKLVRSVDDESKRIFAGVPAQVEVGGGVTSAIALNETMVKGKVHSLIQIAALVLVITALALRSLVAGLLVLLPLATAALMNLGIMGWTGVSLTMGTAAISAMAVGIGADYAIYFIFRVREQLRRTGDLREACAAALTTSGKAIAYVATAVAAGYLCLPLSLFKMHVLLGVLVALTMVIASAATLAFLPAVLIWVQPKFLTRE